MCSDCARAPYTTEIVYGLLKDLDSGTADTHGEYEQSAIPHPLRLSESLQKAITQNHLNFLDLSDQVIHDTLKRIKAKRLADGAAQV